MALESLTSRESGCWDWFCGWGLGEIALLVGSVHWRKPGWDVDMSGGEGAGYMIMRYIIHGCSIHKVLVEYA
jgi:hypothetical protein